MKYAKKGSDKKVFEKMKFDKNAFVGPFPCHGRTVLVEKKVSTDGLDFQYAVWQCKVCKKEYLDASQGRRLERFLLLKKMLSDDAITFERSLNFDGNSYFFRFPKEFVRKGKAVDIRLLDTEGKMFLVEIK
ncbi:MAG: hypothetical protein ABIJ21_02195 [Nanoarchaeota archaeon]